MSARARRQQTLEGEANSYEGAVTCLSAAMQKSVRNNSLLNVKKGLLKCLPRGCAASRRSDCFAPDPLDTASGVFTKQLKLKAKRISAICWLLLLGAETQTQCLKWPCFASESLCGNADTILYERSLGCCSMTSRDILPCCIPASCLAASLHPRSHLQHPTPPSRWLGCSSHP